MKKTTYISFVLSGLLVLSLSFAFAQDKSKTAPKKALPSEVKTPVATPTSVPVAATPTSIQLGTPTASPQAPAPPSKPAYLQELDKLPATQVEWSQEVYDFGEVAMGEKVLYKFTFKNTGTNPLKVTHVKPSCGCTTPAWTKAAIAPGEEGFVEVQFDTKGKKGMQNKSITLFLNTDTQRKVLRFKGVISE